MTARGPVPLWMKRLRFSGASGFLDLAKAAVFAGVPYSLRAVSDLRAALDFLERDQVRAAREMGLSWSAIAWHLRVSRQAAHAKHARHLD